MPEVILEMGPMAAWVPFEQRTIRPFVAQIRPNLFKKASTSVRTVAAERTFWEKATILHHEAHRSKDKSFPQRYSRHYYDLYMMINSPMREKALKQIDLLKDVINFKNKFYRCHWAHYEEALSSGLRLLPPDCHIQEIQKDYAAMGAMVFGAMPDFDTMIEALHLFETEVNEIIWKTTQSVIV
jgi:hypothetical protein